MGKQRRHFDVAMKAAILKEYDAAVQKRKGGEVLKAYNLHPPVLSRWRVQLKAKGHGNGNGKNGYTYPAGTEPIKMLAERLDTLTAEIENHHQAAAHLSVEKEKIQKALEALT